MLWSDFERVVSASQKQASDKQVVQCPKCACSFFEEIEFYQFDMNHHVVLGQKVPKAFTDTIPYILLKCGRCGDVLEPSLLNTVNSLGAPNGYDRFLDQMEGKDDKRTTPSEIDLLKAEVTQLKETVALLLEKGSKKKNDP